MNTIMKVPASILSQVNPSLNTASVEKESTSMWRGRLPEDTQSKFSNVINRRTTSLLLFYVSPCVICSVFLFHFYIFLF